MRIKEVTTRLASLPLPRGPNGHILENIDGGSLADLGALRPGAAGITDGWFAPGERPGYGLAFDLDAFARHEVT